MDNYDFYKELYYKEIERKSEIQNALNIPITIITLLSASVLFFLTTYNYAKSRVLDCVFIALCIILIVLILIAIYYLIKAFSNFNKGFSYSWLPYPHEIFDWHESIKKYYFVNADKIETDAEIRDAKGHFEDYIIRSFIEHTEHNVFINDTRFGYIFKSKKFLILGLIVMIAIMAPYGYNFFNKPDAVQKFEIIDTSH